MKQIFMLLLAAMMLLSFTACDGAEDIKVETTQPQATQPQETEPAETLPELGSEVGKLCYGKDLPIVTGEGETGDTIDPTKTGKVTFINFWGTWCGPCVSELPHLSELAASYSDTLTVIAVHSLEGHKKMPAYIGANYADSQIVFSWETEGDFVGEYYLQLGGGQGYPYTVVLDEKGVITHTKLGMMSYEEMVTMAEEAGARENEKIVPPSLPEATITDAYTFSYESETGATHCFHIPKVTLPDHTEAPANKQIHDTLYPLLEEVKKSAETPYDYLVQMTYTAYQYEDILSLVVQIIKPTNDSHEYYVYNLDVVSGELISDEALYSALDLTPEEGQEYLYSALQEYWAQVQPDDFISLDYIDSMTADTLTTDYLSKAQPFLDSDNHLMFTAMIAVPGGSGSNYYIINGDGVTSHMECEAHN